MNRLQSYTRLQIISILWMGIFCTTGNQAASQEVIVNTALLEGVDITPDNILNFQVQLISNKPVMSRVEGVLQYRNADHKIRYSFTYRLQPGMNMISADMVHPHWNFSSGALRELFTTYKILPQGTYQYCVSVAPNSVSGEGVSDNIVSDCIYKQSEDLFSITLLEPEDDAKLYEYNPMLSWVATYPFVHELTYRLRIAEIKEGQNTYNAITRNNAIYKESNIVPNTVAYPIYAKPLKLWQPYAWTVDAYYRGILLGGAQPWKFTIIEDSLLAGIPRESAHLDIRREQGHLQAYAVGSLKLKYVLEELRTDVLNLELYTDKGKAIELPQKELAAKYGDNRYEIDFKNDLPLRHLKSYTLKIITRNGNRYEVVFKYVNPDLLP